MLYHCLYHKSKILHMNSTSLLHAVIYCWTAMAKKKMYTYIEITSCMNICLQVSRILKTLFLIRSIQVHSSVTLIEYASPLLLNCIALFSACSARCTANCNSDSASRNFSSTSSRHGSVSLSSSLSCNDETARTILWNITD